MKPIKTVLKLIGKNSTGRDHGIPSFNDFRQLCGWPRANSFSDLTDMMPNATVALLQSVYADVNDVDLWVGGLADNRRYGEGITGAVFSCLLERQMSFLRNGDRFWYSHAPDSKLGTQNTAFTAGFIDILISSHYLNNSICFKLNSSLNPKKSSTNFNTTYDISQIDL